MKKLLIILLALAISISAISQEDFQTIKVYDLYSISLPSFLVPTHDNNNEASLMYMSYEKSYYVKVTEQTKQTIHNLVDFNVEYKSFTKDIKGYFDMIDQTSLDYSLCYAFRKKDTIVNGMKAISYTYNKRTEGFDYKIISLYVEGKDTYYQINSWILNENYNSHKDIIEQSMFSFKEL
ncbi:MAG TPA: hypothetical protein DD434_09730 [Bacteroidales bacterium]|nr:hypothetical protein [Bacteroidales bacterium]